ncbi:unnamed protein product, partial [marine sediment metagenome]
MNNSKKKKIGAVVLIFALLGSMVVLPMSGAMNVNEKIVDKPFVFPIGKDEG